MRVRPRIAYLTNAPPTTGVGKPAAEWLARLRATGHPTVLPTELRGADWELDHWELDAERHELRCNGVVRARFRRLPAEPKPLFWWRAARALSKAPPASAIPLRQGFEGQAASAGIYDVWHCTNQTLAFLPRRPKLVTVFDLIELTDPQELFGHPVARLLTGGIRQADGLTAISRYTAREVERLFGVPAADIPLTPLAAGPAYRPIPDVRNDPRHRQLARVHGLGDAAPVVLYVGSEHPRKNLETVVRVVAAVRQKIPSLRFVKVGPPGLPSGRRRFLAALRAHGLEATTVIVEQADDTTLPYWYNRSAVFLFPSLAEGFGIPPLEAMACGTPVVASNRTSLPEVIGDGGLLFDPFDVRGMARAVGRVCADPAFAAGLHERALRRARTFSWEASSATLARAYGAIVSPTERGGSIPSVPVSAAGDLRAAARKFPSRPRSASRPS